MTYALGFPPDHSIGEVVTVLGRSFYLSLVSFTTLGIGDVSPASFAGQLLSGVEALIWFSLLAVLMSVLVRRRY